MKIELELTKDEAFSFMTMLKYFKLSWDELNERIKENPTEKDFINAVNNQVEVLEKIQKSILENLFC